jgi:hypothetical protein
LLELDTAPGEDLLADVTQDKYGMVNLHINSTPDRFHQCFPVMQPRAANQRAIHVKKHQCSGMFQFLTIASSLA